MNDLKIRYGILEMLSTIHSQLYERSGNEY